MEAGLRRYSAADVRVPHAGGAQAGLEEKKKNLARKYREFFYQFDAEGKKAYIRPRFVKICKIFRLAAYLLMAAYLLLMTAAQLPVVRNFSWFPYAFFTDLLNVIYLYPVISLIVLFEIADFLDGALPDPEESMRYDDDTEAQVIMDYRQAQEAHVHPGEHPDGIVGGDGDGVVEPELLRAEGGDFLGDVQEGNGPEEVADVGHVGRDGKLLDRHMLRILFCKGSKF